MLLWCSPIPTTLDNANLNCCKDITSKSRSSFSSVWGSMMAESVACWISDDKRTPPYLLTTCLASLRYALKLRGSERSQRTQGSTIYSFSYRNHTIMSEIAVFTIARARWKTLNPTWTCLKSLWHCAQETLSSTVILTWIVSSMKMSWLFWGLLGESSNTNLKSLCEVKVTPLKKTMLSLSLVILTLK